jgi:tetratricopeptide (TPR) repeat protein
VSYFGTQSVEAHDLYLRARFEWNRRNSESVLRSIDLFRDAVGRDSGYVAAWAGLAEALAVAAFYNWRSPAEAFPEARRVARRALELEPGAGEPYATLGYVALWHDWDLPAAEAEFRRAIALRPRYAQAHQWYANLLTAAGRFDEARAEWRQAAALEPLALIMLVAQGWTEYFAGNPAATVEIEGRAIARDPTFALSHYWLGLGLESQGQYAAAIAAFRRSAALAGDDAMALTGIAHAFAASGQRDSAIAIATKLAAAASGRPLPLFEMATVYVALGDTAQALAWLDRAAATRSHSVVLAPADPRLAPLRGQPRFERLLAAVHR